MGDRQPFESMDVAQANNECKRRGVQVPAKCPKCDSTVILHCDQCNIQVTGCICTEVERFGNAEAVERAISRWGEEEARRRLTAAGLWIPSERRG